MTDDGFLPSYIQHAKRSDQSINQSIDGPKDAGHENQHSQETLSRYLFRTEHKMWQVRKTGVLIRCRSRAVPTNGGGA